MNKMDINEKVSEIFKRHQDSYLQQNVEIIKSFSGVGQQIKEAYEGRVIYELLQNSLDRAESKILVLVHGNYLYVANDGLRFSYMSGYDYDGGNKKRGDFQSICSISNSTKDPNVSIGNKGVGFKSVFSLSSTGYVDLFTQGRIIGTTDSPIAEGEAASIDFRIHDVYNDASAVPEALDESLRTHLQTKIANVQAEHENRGVPGYFFPYQIHEEDTKVRELLTEGYVTIIRIPLDDRGLAVVKTLLGEMKSMHFEFVGLRVKRPITIHFRFGQVAIDYDKAIRDVVGRKNLVTFDLKDKLNDLAKAADLRVSSNIVAVYFHWDTTSGRLYNYLPTLEDSPFKYADFHADFQTSVNRQNISFGGSSAIGRYNQALFDACIELYFASLYLSLGILEQPPFEFKWVDFTKVKRKAMPTFQWRSLELSSSEGHGVESVKKVVGFWHWHFEKVSKLIATLSARYFSVPRKKSEHQAFFTHVERFIYDSNARALRWDDWNSGFYRELARRLQDLGARVIPNEIKGQPGIAPGGALFLRGTRANDDRNVYVPPFIGITVSSFGELSARFRGVFGAREFDSRQDIFKHYRQVAADGSVDTVSVPLSDDEQQSLLRSIASFLNSQFYSTNDRLTCTHRYSGYISRSNEYNTDTNQANFAISTIFLKTIEGTYKPSQLCSFQEIDPNFLPSEWDEDKRRIILLYMGVSPDHKFRFVEGEIHAALKDGLAYIPRPLQQADGSAVPLNHGNTVNNVRVVFTGQPFHPAEINEAYPFMKRFEEAKVRSELNNLLAREYDSWPREFAEHLFDCLDEKKGVATKADLMRIYSHTYSILHTFLGVFLILENGTLSFSKDRDFLVIPNRDDFEMFEGIDRKLLALTNFQDVPSFLTSNVAKYQDSAPEFDQIEPDERGIMAKVKEKLPFLALAISRARHLETNYLENLDKLREMQSRVHGISIHVAKNLRQGVEIDGQVTKSPQKRAFAFEKGGHRLLLEKESSYKVVSEAIGKHVLRVRSLASEIELILFHKEVEDLNVDYGLNEVNSIRRALTEDYDVKLRQFIEKLASRCEVGVERFLGDWNIHRKNHESELLCELAGAGRLNVLDEEIVAANDEADGLFQHLKLLIDKEINLERISDLIARLQKAPNSDPRPFIDRLKRLNQIPHLTATLEKLEGEIKEAFPSIFESETLPENSPAINAQLRRTNNLQEKWDRITSEPPLEQTEVPTTTTVAVFPSSQKVPKGISTSTRNPREDAIIHEKTGREGEERLLRDYIHSFIALPIDEIWFGIQEIAAALKRRFEQNASITTEYLTDLVANCHLCLENKEELRLELMDLMHISARFAFAPFDIVVFENGKVKFIEVKTTKSEPIGPKDSFEFPSAELLEAIHEPDYEIVRITPRKKIPLGNPFYGKMDFPSDIDLGVMLLKADGFIVEYELR